MKAAQELRHLSAEELHLRLRESKKELLKLHSSAAGATAGKIKKNKKNIARIFTLLSEKGREQGGKK